MGEMLNLYEHQSTKNPNIPIRGLMYFARNYSAYIAENDLDIYGTTLQRLPFPQFYVLYNGNAEEEDREENQRNKKRIVTLEQRKKAADLLGQKLLDAGRTEELRRALTDEAYQLEMMKELELI